MCLLVRDLASRAGPECASARGNRWQRGSIKPMRAARSTKQKHQVPWTFVASAKRAKPRLVLVSHLDASAHRPQPKRASQRANASELGNRLEQAFVRAVKTAKRNAARKA